MATRGRECSIETLYNEFTEKYDREPNPDEIWMLYASKTDSDKVTTDCFHSDLSDL